jgi:hypothetical protein
LNGWLPDRLNGWLNAWLPNGTRPRSGKG